MLTPLTKTVSTQMPHVWNMTLRWMLVHTSGLVKTMIAHARPTAPRSPPHVATSESFHGILPSPEKFISA